MACSHADLACMECAAKVSHEEAVASRLAALFNDAAATVAAYRARRSSVSAAARALEHVLERHLAATRPRPSRTARGRYEPTGSAPTPLRAFRRVDKSDARALERLRAWRCDEFADSLTSLAVNTRQAYVADLGAFVVWAYSHGIKRPADVDHTVIHAYLVELRKNAYAPRSIARKTATLKRYFRWVRRRDDLTVGPLDPMRRTVGSTPRRRLPRVVPQAELDALLDPAPEDDDPVDDHDLLRDRTILGLLYDSGIRVSELCGLNVGDVDLRHRSITVWGKGARQRRLPVAKITIETLGIWLSLGRCRHRHARCTRCEVSIEELGVIEDGIAETCTAIGALIEAHSSVASLEQALAAMAQLRRVLRPAGGPMAPFVDVHPEALHLSPNSDRNPRGRCSTRGERSRVKARSLIYARWRQGRKPAGSGVQRIGFVDLLEKWCGIAVEGTHRARRLPAMTDQLCEELDRLGLLDLDSLDRTKSPRSCILWLRVPRLAESTIPQPAPAPAIRGADLADATASGSASSNGPPGGDFLTMFR